MNENLCTEIINQSIFRINESHERIVKCCGWLTKEQIWQHENENTNSVGNLILHLIGNIQQYIVSGLGNVPDNRSRDDEFKNIDFYHELPILDNLQNVVLNSSEIIKTLNEVDLMKKYHVQGFAMSGMGILLHVVEHLSYHTGQITYFTKLTLNKPTDYYKNLDLNKKNKTK